MFFSKILMAGIVNLCVVLNTNAEKIAMNIENSQIALAKVKSQKIEKHDNRIIAKGIGLSRGTALTIKDISVTNWQQYNYFSLQITSDFNFDAAQVFILLRNNNSKYSKVQNTFLRRNVICLKNQKKQITFNISSINRENINEIRIYLNTTQKKEQKFEIEFEKFEFEGSRQLYSEVKSDTARENIFGKTLLFPRNQSKYTLMNNFFLQEGWFIDRPLFLDRRFATAPKDSDRNYENFNNFKRSAELCIQSGFDGFALLSVDVNDSYLALAKKGLELADSLNMPGFYILPEIAIFKYGTFNSYLNQLTRNIREKNQQISSRHMDELIGAALKSKSALRCRNKVVISSYNADFISPVLWKELLSLYKKKYNDEFLFIPDIGEIIRSMLKRYYKNRGLTKEELNEFKEYICSYLDVCDGLLVAGVVHFSQPPDHYNVYLNYYEKIIISILNKIMSQSKYRNKLLGLSCAKGYVNHFAGQTVTEEGTETLRQTFEISMQAKPDFMILTEWNEVNENTNIEPTVSDARTNMRIGRYYNAKYNKLALDPLPGDNLEMPNMVISFRRILMIGEIIDIELLNIPETLADKTKKNYMVQLILESIDGKRLFTSKNISMQANTLKATHFKIPSEKFSGQRLLLPAIKIISKDGTEHIIRKGLDFITLKVNSNWNYKYCKRPFRDITFPEKFSVEYEYNKSNNQLNVNTNIKCQEKIRFIEIIKNDIPVYSYDASKEYATDDNEMLVKVTWSGWNSAKSLYSPFNFKVINGTFTQCKRGNYGWGVVAFQMNPDNIAIKNPQIRYGTPKSILMTTKFGKDAEIKFSANKQDFIIPLEKLRKNGKYIISLDYGLNIVFTDFHGIPDIPFPLDANEAKFETNVFNIAAKDIISIRIITMDGRIYRSAPYVCGQSKKKLNAQVFSETKGRAIKVKVPELNALQCDYSFTPDYGALVAVKKGEGFENSAFLGGGIAYGEPFFLQPRSYPANARKNAPKWLRSDEQWVLDFDGIGNYMVFPQNAIPHGAFSYVFEIKPESKSKQVLLKNYGKVFGPLAIYMENGSLRFDYINRSRQSQQFVSPKIIELDKWNKIAISYDLVNIKLKVNGKTWQHPCNGVGSRANKMIFGGWGTGTRIKYFKGKLRKFTIYPYGIL